MSKIKKDESGGALYKIARVIVDKRNLFFLLFAFAVIFCLFSQNWVKVEEDVTKYLPKSTETRRGVDLMNREFVTYASADVMVTNISYERAVKLQKEIEQLDGVSGVEFDNDDKHFRSASALFNVSFKYEAEDDRAVRAFDNVKEHLKHYTTYVKSDIGASETDSLNKDMRVIIIIAAIIIISVLLFTSRTYGEIPVLLITFVVAGILNKGTNFLLGKISFISNSVAIVLQLALAIDYAIILCHRYTEEHAALPPREAAINALGKAIVEISSSSLTTISGLLALVTMQFGIGRDLAFVLIKAIFFSLLSVFTLMPGLLVVFSKLIDSTEHKSFVPKISALGKFVYKTRKVVPAVFVAVAAVCAVLANMCPYCYGNGNLSTMNKDEKQIARDKINSTFTQKNMLALIVPAESYEKEAALLAELEACPEVDYTQGLSNTEALDGYMLTESVTARDFSELADVDYSLCAALFAAHAVEAGSYGEVLTNLDSYSVPLIDMLIFLHDESARRSVVLDDELTEDINKIYDKITEAKAQLQSDDYSRMLVYLTLPEEGEQTFAFLEKMHTVVEKYYEKDSFCIVGDSTSDYDLSSSFSRDNLIISILSALFVILVLLFTFMSAGLPLLLIAVIQGSIWINFSFPYIMDSKLYFLGYLIVNAIQMGANIDYAIVISNRFTELKKTMPVKDAVTEALNLSFPTIITSGAILASAGALIGLISTNGVVSSMGVCLGRGTVISMLLVMCVLPQILLIGDSIVEKTSFKLKTPELVIKTSGTMLVNGRVRGHVSGIVDASIHGVIKGDVSAMVQTGNISPVNENKEAEVCGDDKADKED